LFGGRSIIIDFLKSYDYARQVRQGISASTSQAQRINELRENGEGKGGRA